MKLLCRLYDPDSGRTGVDGVSLTDLDLEELRSHISIVFQDFARYQLSARENISLSVRSPPRMIWPGFAARQRRQG